MNTIKFPLTQRMSGPDVADLHVVLQLLLDRAVIAPDDPTTRQSMMAALQGEQRTQSYSSVTAKIVAMYQETQRLPITGNVDQATAAALNAFIRSVGTSPTPSAPPPPAIQIVSGTVRREDGLPVLGARVRAFHDQQTGAIRLGEDVTDGDGHYTVRYEVLPGTPSIDLKVTASDERGLTLQTSQTVRGAKPLVQLDLIVPVTDDNGAARRVEGRLLLDYGEAADNVTLRLYRRAFGGGAALLSETTTRAHGVYALPYVANGNESLEVRALDAAGAEIPISTVVHDDGVTHRTVMNLVAPGTLRPLASEFDRLSEALTPQVGDMRELGNAREDTERQDLTLLNRATGWDARLIALAANAATMAADNTVPLAQDELYALFRAGLPTDPLQLAAVSSDVVADALASVGKAGIVALDDQRIAGAKQRFESFATATRLAVPTPGSRSTYGDLLQSSGLSADARARFASVYLTHEGEPAELWTRARQAGVSEAEVATLQQQGKFSFLTHNNAAMTQRLQQTLQIGDPVQLVDRDFDRSDTWKSEVRALAANDTQQLEALIPPSYAGETVDARLDAYAEDMARKVRISYPTQVVTRLVERDADDAFQLGNARAPVVTMLKSASQQGFKLGATPVEAFLREHPQVAAAIPASERSVATAGMKTLQRLYQLTPGNDAMIALMKTGLTSAYDITALTEIEFLDRYSSYFPSREHAELVYRKAVQVSSVTTNLYGMVKEMDSTPSLTAISPRPEVKALARNELIKHFPTMEALFGSLDFCECEHCRSVLSPAAYLVDLLQFVDPDDARWQGFLDRWKKDHGGKEYTDEFKKPFDALAERRPDLVHIPLTCENTQTALPYIDIVNEILEYYVAHNTLAPEAAHDTGNATTPELLAEPQHIVPAAYDALAQARYPIPLPFDLWLETVRRFLEHNDVPLARVMEALREGDELFAPAQSYDRSAIFIESLGFSPAEAAILTDPAPLATWFTLYGFADEGEATTVAVDANSGQRIDLNSAKALSRRLGLTYKELVAIIRTGFVNPRLEALVVLSKLGLTASDAIFYAAHRALLAEDPDTLDVEERKRLGEVQGIEARLDDATARHAANGFDARAWMDEAIATSAFDQVLVLADHDQGCNFDETTLQYANGSACDAIAFTRLNHFVRIWRKLGWSIAETDRALVALTPATTPYDEPHLAERPLATTLVHLAHLKALEQELPLGKRAREKLLAFWTPIGTTGANPLYAELLLTRSVLQSDPVFDDPLGRYLATPGIPLQDHLLALQGALGIAASDVARVLAATGTDLAAAELTLDTVSLLYRYALLAKALKLPIEELIALRELSGLDPFAPIAAAPFTTLADDTPFTQTLQFIRHARVVKESGFKVSDLQYLLRHRFDPEGAFRPDTDAMIARVKALADGIRAIRTLHAVPVDAAAIDDEALRQTLALVLPADVVARLAAMLAGTAEVTVTVGGVAPADALTPAAFAAFPNVRHVGYSPTTQQQTLTYRGVLFDEDKGAIAAVVATPVAAALLDAVQRDARDFFDGWLLKQPPGTNPDSGFLRQEDFDILFAPIPDALTPDQAQRRIRDRRAALARSFLPYLQRRLVREFVVRTMAADSGANAEFVDALLTDAMLLGDPAPLVEAFGNASTRGVDATFFASTDLSDAPLASALLTDADTALAGADGIPALPAGAGSARIEGFVEVATPGAYRFHLVLDRQDAVGVLRFAHLPTALVNGTAAADGAEVSDFTTLKAGLPYRFTLELQNLGGGGARLLVQGETLPKDRLARLALYPASVVDRIDRASMLFAKALRVVQGLQLDERELRHILGNAAAFGGVSLSALPTRGSDDTPDAARALFTQWLRLAEYARLKADVAGGGDGLIDVFAAPTPDEAYAALARLTRRDAATVRETAQTLLPARALTDEQAVARVWEALQLVELVGVPVRRLVECTSIVDTTRPPDARRAIARAMKDAVRARFDRETWHKVAQPIFDGLRQRQRDALAAHVMHQHGFGTIEQLYEYFLIDPGMEPVVQTSRIRLAIASVQLFIQRTLLNLEPAVHPAVINAGQWEWMKRYRVWEANRKIFLFPENWLEPEFRDDKTHLFTELEGSLLQGDISNDLAEDAFLAYLQKLEALARLEIVGLHCQDSADATLNTLHVIGRTYTQPHQFFHRQFSNRMWTPWEPVGVEPEGNHIAPVFWRDRLYLFWITFLEQGDKPNFPSGSSSGMLQVALNTTAFEKAGLTVANTVFNASPSGSKKLTDATLDDLTSGIGGATQSKIVQAQLHWSEYMQGEWSPPRSGPNDPVLTARVPANFDANSVFVHVSTLRDADGEELGVKIHLGGAFNRAFHLAGRNSVPESATRNAPPPMPYSNDRARANRYAGSGPLRVTLRSRISTEDGKTPVVTTTTPTILQQGGVFTILPADNAITLVNAEVASMVTPFFYQDNTEHTFFVEPSFTERTIEQWEEWVTQTPVPDHGWRLDDDFWKDHVVPAIPKPKVVVPIDPRDPIWNPKVAVESRFQEKMSGDWLLNESTALHYGGEIIGPVGRAPVQVLASPSLAGARVSELDAGRASGLAGPIATEGRTFAEVAVPLPVASELGGRNVVLTASTPALESAGLSPGAGGTLRVVGNQGLNAALRRSFSASTPARRT